MRPPTCPESRISGSPGARPARVRAPPTSPTPQLLSPGKPGPGPRLGRPPGDSRTFKHFVLCLPSFVCTVQGFVLFVVHLAQNKGRARPESGGKLRAGGGNARTGHLYGDGEPAPPVSQRGRGTTAPGILRDAPARPPAGARGPGSAALRDGNSWGGARSPHGAGGHRVRPGELAREHVAPGVGARTLPGRGRGSASEREAWGGA